MQVDCPSVASRKLLEGQALWYGIVAFEMSDSALVKAVGRAVQKAMRAYHREDSFPEFDLVDYFEGCFMTEEEHRQQVWIDELSAAAIEEEEHWRECHDRDEGCYLTAEQMRWQEANE